MTANASPSEYERCAAVGMDEVLVRPLLLDTIDRMLRRLVGVMEPDDTAPKPVDLTSGPLPAKIHMLLQQSLRQSVGAIDTALDKGDLQSVRDHLHALRGSFAMIREMETADMAANMETLIASKDRESLKTAMQLFAEHASSVLERRAAMHGDVA